MYVGEPSVFCLKAYIDGWLTGTNGGTEAMELMVGFQKHIERRFRVTGTQSWDRIIFFHSSNQYTAMTEALDLFLQFADGTMHHDSTSEELN